MSRTILIITVISFLQCACGGARSPTTQTLPNDNFISITSDASLSWQAPAEYTDATPISPSEIGGYRVYAGTSKSNLIPVANIPDSTATKFSLAQLGKGPLYITVTCYDTKGAESNFSSILAINII